MTGATTAVIGAGISGLTAGKMLGDYGGDYTYFESSDRIGGNWAFGNPNGRSSAYRSFALALPGQYEDYLALAGPTWRNEIDAGISLELGSYRPVRYAAGIRCPLLVQIGDLDRSAPPGAAAKAAFAGRAEVRHYPCDHFDVWPGKPWFDHATEHQRRFLRRHLQPAA